MLSMTNPFGDSSTASDGPITPFLYSKGYPRHRQKGDLQVNRVCLAATLCARRGVAAAAQARSRALSTANPYRWLRTWIPRMPPPAAPQKRRGGGRGGGGGEGAAAVASEAVTARARDLTSRSARRNFHPGASGDEERHNSDVTGPRRVIVGEVLQQREHEDEEREDGTRHRVRDGYRYVYRGEPRDDAREQNDGQDAHQDAAQVIPRAYHYPVRAARGRTRPPAS